MGEGEKPGEGAGKPGEGGATPEKSNFSAPKPGFSVGKDVKTTQHERKVGNEAPKPAAPAAGGGAPAAGGGAKKPAGPSRKISLGPVYKKDIVKDAHVWSSKDGGGDDKTFVTVLQADVKVEALSAQVDLDKKTAKLTLIEGKAEGVVAHGQVDLIDKIKHLIFGDPPKPPPAPTQPMAARVGDLTMHLGPLAPGTGSPNVFIGGQPAWRVGLDVHLCPAPGSPHGAGPASPGATSVLINGAPAARATDFIIEPTGGPDVIAIGFPSVLIGLPTPPPPPPKPKDPEPEDLPWVKFESVASADFVKGEAKATVGAEGDLAKRSGKIEAGADASVALLKGELPLKMRIRIPFTTYYVGLGVKVEGSLITAGAGANARLAINEGPKLFEASAGAKVGAGLAGAGAKFSVDISK